MEWTTLFISGIPYFAKEVLVQMQRSGITVMPGTTDRPEIMVVWVDKQAPLHDIKKAIGAKLILKHRLRFSYDADLVEETSRDEHANEFTQRELDMINNMKLWDNSRKK
jgi:hypothetical protein